MDKMSIMKAALAAKKKTSSASLPKGPKPAVTKGDQPSKGTGRKGTTSKADGGVADTDVLNGRGTAGPNKKVAGAIFWQRRKG